MSVHDFIFGIMGFGWEYVWILKPDLAGGFSVRVVYYTLISLAGL